MEKRIIINDYIKNDPLSENNLDNALDLVNKIRLSSPQKSIWLYTGYKTFGITKEFWGLEPNIVTDKVIAISNLKKRSDIICQCDVLVDGQYVEAQRDTTLPWVGSSNQRIIRIQESLQKGGIVLWRT